MSNKFFEEMPLSSGDTKWIIELDRYERDNLLALLNAVGFPALYKKYDAGAAGGGNETSTRRVMPDPALARWNSGDWVGQIAWKLKRSDGVIDIDELDSPNYTGES